MTCVHSNNHVKAYPYFDGGQDLMLLESQSSMKIESGLISFITLFIKAEF